MPMFYFVMDFTELEGLFVGEQFLDKWNVQQQLQQKIITIKTTIFSIAMGLKTPIFHESTCQVVIRQFVIGQFNKPITFKVVTSWSYYFW